MASTAFDLGSFLRGLLAVTSGSQLTAENPADGQSASVIQAGAGQLGAVVDNRLMLTGPWEKLQPWLVKHLRAGPGARLLVHFRFPGDQERAVLTAVDKLRRQHNLKPLLPANTWVYPPMSSADDVPLSKLSTVCTVVNL
jgi:hypothetical protein